MLIPRSSAIGSAFLSSSPSASAASPSSLPPLRLPSSPSATSDGSGNVLVIAALSLLSLFRPASPKLPSRALAMRGGGKPTPLATSTAGASPGRGPPKSLAFSSPESLSDWLRPRLPSDSFASWGVKPGTKTVHNLWLELSQGETSLLQEDPVQYQPPSDHNQTPLPGDGSGEEELPQQLLLRTVHVATVRIRNRSGAILVESHQLLSDGTVRHRCRPLSEKMKPGESVEDAATRAVLEELGSRDVRILPGTYEMKVEERASASYPGLPARYILHSVDAEVVGLPEDGEFSTEETGEGHQEADSISDKVVFVRKHFWKWIYGDPEDFVEQSTSAAVS